MSIYDTYGYLGVQIKNRADGISLSVGDYTPLSTGLHFGYEGVVVVRAREVMNVIPYGHCWDKWGSEIGPETKAMVEDRNPVKAAVDSLEARGCGWPSGRAQMGPEYEIHSRSFDADPSEILDLISQTKKEVEAEMAEAKAKKPYWMVHRRGKKTSPTTVIHDEFSDAVTEATRLARLEMDSFTILEAVMLVKPVLPVEVDIEPFDVFGDYFDELLSRPVPKDNWWVGRNPGSPDVLKQEGAAYPESLDPEPECTCDPDSDMVGILCEALDGEHYTSPVPEPECTCAPGPEEGCNVCGGFDERAFEFEPIILPFDASEDLIDALTDALTYSLANAFGIPADLLEPFDCCDEDSGHEEVPPFMHDPEDECEICAGIALDELPEIEVDEECCDICAGIAEDLAEAEEPEVEDEECEICAIMEKLDMPAIYYPPLGKARCVMTEPDPLTDDPDNLLGPHDPDCGYGCNETEVSSNCMVHAGELYQPEPVDPHQFTDDPTPDCGFGCNDTEISSNCQIHVHPEPKNEYAGWSEEDFNYALGSNLRARRSLLSGLGAINGIDEPEGCCGGTKDDCCRDEPEESKGCCDENEAAVRSYMQYHGITEEEAKAEIKDLCGY